MTDRKCPCIHHYDEETGRLVDPASIPCTRGPDRLTPAQTATLLRERKAAYEAKEFLSHEKILLVLIEQSDRIAEYLEELRVVRDCAASGTIPDFLVAALRECHKLNVTLPQLMVKLYGAVECD